MQNIVMSLRSPVPLPLSAACFTIPIGAISEPSYLFQVLAEPPATACVRQLDRVTNRVVADCQAHFKLLPASKVRRS